MYTRPSTSKVNPNVMHLNIKCKINYTLFAFTTDLNREQI